MRFIVFSLFMMLSNGILAQNYIQKWDVIKKTKDFSLEKTLEKNQCFNKKEQLKIFKMKNPAYLLLREGSPIYIPNCVVSKKYEDKELDINKWDNKKVDKGFILSVELAKRECKDLYKKQIPHFYKKNKKKMNVDNISIGEEVLIQSCIQPKVVKKPKVKTRVLKRTEEVRHVFTETFYKRKSAMMVGQNHDNERDLFGAGFDLKSKTFDLMVNITEDSNLLKANYHHFLDKNSLYSIVVGGAMRFSLDDDETLSQKMANFGVGITLGTFHWEFTKNFLHNKDYLNAKVEWQFSKDYGLQFEYMNFRLDSEINDGDQFVKETKNHTLFTGYFKFYFD